MQEKIKFVAGMEVPVGSVVYTKSGRAYSIKLMEDIPGASPREDCTIFGYDREGWQNWRPSGYTEYGSTDTAFQITHISLPEAAPAPLFQVGDTVYSTAYGKGTVTASRTNGVNYPVSVQFTHGEKSFNKLGAEYQGHARSLFFAPLEVNATHLQRPRPTFKPNNVVLNKRSGVIAVVSHDQASSNYTYLYRAGGTSGDTTTASSTDLQLIAESFTKE